MAKKIIRDNSKQVSAGKSFLKVLGWAPRPCPDNGDFAQCPGEVPNTVVDPLGIIPFWVQNGAGSQQSVLLTAAPRTQ